MRALVREPLKGAPHWVSAAELLALWSGELVLFTSRASLVGQLAKFDFSWFVPAIVKYRRHLLALPMAYFQARRVRDAVARVRELENICSFLSTNDGYSVTATVMRTSDSVKLDMVFVGAAMETITAAHGRHRLGRADQSATAAAAGPGRVGLRRRGRAGFSAPRARCPERPGPTRPTRACAAAAGPRGARRPSPRAWCRR